MLISHGKKFIFIHIYKNAGTSIIAALLPVAAPQWQISIGQLLRKLHIPNGFDVQPYHDHITAPQLIEKMGQDAFRSYFSFAFVRNPWDWQVSLYRYMLQEPAHGQHQLVKSLGSFEKYIEWRVAKETKFQRDFVFSPSGEKLVGFIGRFENLERDFRTVCSRIGVSTPLPRLNSSGLTPYQEFYTPRTRQMVERAFEPDILQFEYSF